MTRIRCWFFFSSRRRHTRFDCDWSSDVCSSDLRTDSVRIEILASFRESGHSLRRVARSTDLPMDFQAAELEYAFPAFQFDCELIGIERPTVRLFSDDAPGAIAIDRHFEARGHQIGRASCRERV